MCYFCEGCKYFLAMVECDEEERLKPANNKELKRPDLFVLTNCKNENNKNDNEGNTNVNDCPLV